MGQFHMGRLYLVSDIFGIKTEKKFVDTLEDIIREQGAMDSSISDSTQVEISNKVRDLSRGHSVDDWQSEAHFQHQNFAERGHQDVKHCAIIIMNATGAS